MWYTLPYIIKSLTVLATLYIYYMVVMRRHTFFTLHRFYLLGSMILSVSIPWIQIELSHPAFQADTIVVFPEVLSYVQDNYVSSLDSSHPVNWIAWIYWAGFLFFIFRYLFSVIHIFRLSRQYSHKKRKGLHFIFLPKQSATFSFFNHLFIDPQQLNRKSKKEIFEHEKIHIRQIHSLDLFIAELICITNWYNPFVWMTKSAILQNHEYIADRQVIKKFQTDSYLQLLVNQTLKGAFSFTNYFCCSNLKKRMIMMTKQPSDTYRILHLAPAFLLAALLFIGFSCSNALEDETIWETEKVTQMPVFQGKDPGTRAGQTVQQWVGQHVRYPREAMESNIQGKVYVQFVIEKDGKVSNVKVVQSPDTLLSREAARLVSSMPDWTPGKIKDEVVRVSYVLPINFRLSGPENTNEAPFQVVEEMPVFPEGNVIQWIAKKTEYPKYALEHSIQGKVYVQFVIEKDGRVTGIKVVRGVDSSLDKEAIRIVASMPKWIPGKQKGQNVRVSYTLPINFQIP